MAGRLGIHVLGPRFGESIILELPDGGVGVIDSFAPQRGSHPVVEFLGSARPDLKTLRFFALTHPHADHCLRSAEVIDRWRPDEVWVFDPFPAGDVQWYYDALARHGRTERVEAALALPVGTVSESLLQLDHRIRRPITAGSLRFRPMAGGQLPAHFCKRQIRVSFLTPVPERQYAYRAAVAVARRILADGPALRPADELPDVDHNLTSGAVLVEYGKTRALLMADAEGERWEEWLAQRPPLRLRRPVHFVKASHHGSNNGYHQPLYALVGDRATTLGVLTPFNRQARPLPTAAGVAALRPHLGALYCTNRGQAIRSTGLPWLPVSSTPPPAQPRQWGAMISRDPTLLRLLVPEAGGVGASLAASVPSAWVADAIRDPSLWRLIRPELRPATVAGPVAVECFVSAFYDNRGSLLELRVGSEAGRLA
ncbi:MAG: MBL fold metallo-hydrolase [Gemmataceae bacterium]